MRIGLKIGVGVIALLLALLGFRWMFAPESIAQEQGMVLGGLHALSTGRADLGGMFVGATLLCLLGLRAGQEQLLVAVAVVIGAIAVGRTVGLVADGFDRTNAVLIVVEVLMVAVLLGAARGAPARGSASAGG